MSAWYRLFLLLAALVVLGARSDNTRLKDVFAWKTVDYVFPSDAIKNDLLNSKEFLPHRTMPLGLELWRNKLFLTTPRRKAGVPVVLGYIDVDSKEKSPLVIPYPSYESNLVPSEGQLEESDNVFTAYRIRADACDRLWVIDTGLADVGAGHVRIAKPRLLIYNLLDDTLLRKYVLPDEDFLPRTFFASIAVDVTAQSCDDAFAYMPDLGAYGLVVYSFKHDDSWRIKHNYFYFDPLAGDFNIDGFNFQLTDGAFSAALSEIKPDGFRTFYFHSLSSYNEFAVSTRILQNKTIATKSFHQFRNLGTRGPNSHSSGSFLDEKTGVLFLLEISNHAVTCWNTRTRQSMEGNIGVVASDTLDRSFIYPCDVKVDSEDNLWTLHNNIPRYINGDLNPEQYNYFIFKATVQDAIRGTACDGNVTSSGGSHPPPWTAAGHHHNDGSGFKPHHHTWHGR